MGETVGYIVPTFALALHIQHLFQHLPYPQATSYPPGPRPLRARRKFEISGAKTSKSLKNRAARGALTTKITIQNQDSAVDYAKLKTLPK